MSDDVQREASGRTNLGPDGLFVLRAPIGSRGEAIDRRGVVPVDRATVLDRDVLRRWRPGAADEEEQLDRRRDERGSPDRDHFRRLSITARTAAAPVPKPSSARRKSRREWDHWHFASIVRLISSGEANTMDARSPCMPAGSS